MRARARLAGALASIAVLGLGWQLGSAAMTTTSVAASTGLAPAAGGTTGGSTSSSSSGGSGTSSGSGTSGSTSAGSAIASTDGTFTGSSVSTRFGSVQVQITVSQGTVTDVQALHLTDADRKSVSISNRAAPILRSEVLAAQSAQVQSVSGATYTSAGYLLSLQSALDQAGL